MKKLIIWNLAFMIWLGFGQPSFTAEGYATRVIENGTKVNLIIGDTIIPATFNDGKTAKALLARLPFTMRLHKYAHDY